MFRRNRRLAAKETQLSAPDGLEPLDLAEMQSESTAFAAITKLFDVYQPGVVFSEPVSVGDNTVITAAEVQVGMGLGFGHGSGSSGNNESGGGGGVGGGGGSAGRPVAAIVISPNGVHVEPIVDVTKIGLAFFTTIGAMFLAWRTMRRGR